MGIVFFNNWEQLKCLCILIKILDWITRLPQKEKGGLVFSKSQQRNSLSVLIVLLEMVLLAVETEFLQVSSGIYEHALPTANVNLGIGNRL